MTDGEFTWPEIVKQRWEIEGVERPLPKLGSYARLYEPEGLDERLYRVVWINHQTHKVGLELMG